MFLMTKLLAIARIRSGVNALQLKLILIVTHSDFFSSLRDSRASLTHTQLGIHFHLHRRNMASNNLLPVPVTDIDRAIDTIADAFNQVPLFFAFVIEIDVIPPPYPAPSVDRQRVRDYYAQGITNLYEDGAVVVQTGNWSAVAIWEPPGFEGKPFTNSGSAGPMRTAWRARVAAAKEKHLRGRTYWHLGFLARNPKADVVPGAISALIRPYLDRAKADGVPAWLEAVDERGVAIYQHFGFKLVDQVVVGENTHNKIGWPEDGGEGVSGYCMIYEP